MFKDEFDLAYTARKNAYSPYSNYTVGAVLKTKSGKFYTGCNIENGGIQSICAERVAFAKALSEGERDFEAIFVVGGNKDSHSTEECLPCGYCRQFMKEFVKDDFKIVTSDGNDVKTYTIEDLLPHGFKL